MDEVIEGALISVTEQLTAKFLSVLENTLAKLGRYDEGSFIGSILSFTVRHEFLLAVQAFRATHRCGSK
jgi:hypothetical protein